jgi:hypothetical protein
MKKRFGGLSLDIQKAEEVVLQELTTTVKQAEVPAKRGHLELTKIEECLYISSNKQLDNTITRLGVSDRLRSPQARSYHSRY